MLFFRALWEYLTLKSVFKKKTSIFPVQPQQFKKKCRNEKTIIESSVQFGSCSKTGSGCEILWVKFILQSKVKTGQQNIFEN